MGIRLDRLSQTRPIPRSPDGENNSFQYYWNGISMFVRMFSFWRNCKSEICCFPLMGQAWFHFILPDWRLRFRDTESDLANSQLLSCRLFSWTGDPNKSFGYWAGPNLAHKLVTHRHRHRQKYLSCHDPATIARFWPNSCHFWLFFSLFCHYFSCHGHKYAYFAHAKSIDIYTNW